MRTLAKHQRTEAILDEATKLFARDGYARVSLDDIGAATGVSGPAVYRHFSGKQALLGAILVRVSEHLLRGGEEALAEASTPTERMHALIRFHVRFAQHNAEVIRVQDREIGALSEEDRGTVRRLQRAYVGLWIDALGDLITADRAELRLRVQACFGLINSTPHSIDSSARTSQRTATVLFDMARAALLA